MKIRITILLCVLPSLVWSQKNSPAYLLKRLNTPGISDSAAAATCLDLAAVFRSRQSRTALAYAQSALDFAARSKLQDLVTKASLSMGQHYLDLGRYDSSLAMARTCITRSEEKSDSNLLFSSLNLAGNACLSNAQPSRAREYFERALAMATQSPQLPQVSRIYHNMGNYYFKSLQPDKAIASLQRARGLEQGGTDSLALMTIYSTLGQLYVFVRKVDSAQSFLLPALSYFHREHRIREEAAIHQNLGSAFGQLKNNAEMEKHINAAYQQFLSLGDDPSALNALMQKITVYLSSFQYRKCLSSINEIEPAAAQARNPNILSLCYGYKDIIFSLLGDTSSASVYRARRQQVITRVHHPTILLMNRIINTLLLNPTLSPDEKDPAIKQELAAARKMIPASILEASMEAVSVEHSILKTHKDEFSKVYNLVLPDQHSDIRQLDSLINQQPDAGPAALYNRQLTELETRFRTQLKDDSIRAQSQLIAVKNKSIRTQTYLLSVLALMALIALALLWRSQVQGKKIGRQFVEIQQLQSELKHRTGNFFNSIRGMLSIAANSTKDRDTIDSLTRRVSNITRLYNILYSSTDNADLPFNEFLHSICTHFQNSFGLPRNIRVVSQCEVAIQKEQAIPLAFIITELLANAEKYAFNGRPDGEIRVMLTTEAGRKQLHVFDNGTGRDEGQPARAGSQGMTIIRSYAKNLNGTIRTWNDKGYHFNMSF